MCFSAVASFTAAGVTGLVGVATLSRVESWRAMPLAATPMIFAAQQTIEGTLWGLLPVAPNGAAASLLISLFLFFAYVFWPVFVPAALLILEPDKRLRRPMLLCLAVGIAVGGHLLWWLLTRSHAAFIEHHHILYETGYHASLPVALAYLVATGLPLALSSQRWVRLLGAIVLSGAIIAYFFYWQVFVSVWCFFAAVSSGLILGHFQSVRQSRPGRVVA